ncbi:MFS transporter [Microtetraspora sp. NBRC 13810]|uniref:MFS transporter n=1 Tax=Microtetraspora sp. NBRC 13810 TaxID=3030990 RepID=UPI0024A16DA2|nr:MFS transporter [Microtetraspora sp. NBRC 13810]GLW10376.1 MFS transporter [Microtetraspora sp. NBRC 13810]
MTGIRRRLSPLADRNLRLYFAGAATSLLGSSMSALAVVFAVLHAGGGQSDLGYVMAARIVPIVAFMLVGGVVADRFGPRRVLLAADVLQCVTQAAFAAALLLGRPPIWTFFVFVAIWGIGEGFAMPARGALVPGVVAWGRQYDGKLRDANALYGLAQSAATVAGPALAGLLVASAGSGAVILLDAVTYALSAVALLLLRLPAHAAAPVSSGRLAVREGWREFSSRTWLWVTTLHFTLFNLAVWAPFLVLGPVVAERDLGGARDWGLVMAVYGAGALAGGLALVGGRVLRRPLVVATAATFGWAVPSAALAAGAPFAVLLAAALVAGIGSAVCSALYATANQQHVPAEVLARVTSLTGMGAFALGPLGLAVAGPAAEAAGTGAVLGFGAVFQVVLGLSVLAVPAVRRLGAAPDRATAIRLGRARRAGGCARRAAGGRAGPCPPPLRAPGHADPCDERMVHDP